MCLFFYHLFYPKFIIINDISIKYTFHYKIWGIYSQPLHLPILSLY